MSNINYKNVFEVIGVYFANTYWNVLYKEAYKAYKEKQSASLEEAYRETIEKYSRGFCSPADKNERVPKYYVMIIKDLHNNFREYLGSGETLMGFIDIISSFLLPNEYYKSLSQHDTRKDIIVRKIMIKTVMTFTIYIAQEEVRKVTDEKIRPDKKHVSEWKKKFIDILNQERNAFSTLLLAQGSGIDIKNKEEIPHIPKEVYDKLQQTIKKLLLEKHELTVTVNKYAKYIGVLKKIINEKDFKSKTKSGPKKSSTSESSSSSSSSSSSESEEEPETPVVSKNRRGGNARPISKTTKFNKTSKLSTLTKKPQLEPEELQPKVEVPVKSEALQQLENEEYSGEEIIMENANIEEFGLPSGDEMQADEL